MSKFNNKRKAKIIDILYLERSSEIEKENYNDEYRATEVAGDRLEEMLTKFLRENMTREKFEIANHYIESLYESRETLKSMSNKIFYGAGFGDGVKL